jgi:hypothetical protein
MTPKPKMTRQGIRDLNEYGPKKPKLPAGSPPAANQGETPDAPATVPKNPEAPERRAAAAPESARS